MKRPLLAMALAAVSLQATAVDHYTIDPDHTYPSFEADHMGLSVWRGKFDKTSGRIVVDKTAHSGSVEIAIDMGSVDFGLDALNTWATGPALFETAKYPRAGYKGKLADFVEGVPTRVLGKLTLHGVTHPLDLKIESFKCIPHPLYKRQLCGADASASFDRTDYGLVAGKDYGFDMRVTLRIQVEALKDE